MDLEPGIGPRLPGWIFEPGFRLTAAQSKKAANWDGKVVSIC